MRRPLAVLSLAFVGLLAGCPGGVPEPEPNPEPAVEPEPDPTPDAPYGFPRDDVVPRVGREDAVDIATWNIENFPATVDTPEVVADLVASLDLDLVAVQEIADAASFDELVDRLPGYEGVLSSHTYGDGSYQKVGFLYRSSLLSPSGFGLLFTGNGYEFPRPPAKATFTVLGDDGAELFDFTAITVHLKAGGGFDDRDRREDAAALLEGFIADQVSGSADEDVVLLGDFNEVLTTANGRNVFAPFLDDGGYTVQSQVLADQGRESFVDSGRVIDHIITTAALDDELDGVFARIPRLNDQLDSYDWAVSDHLPVVLPLPVVE